MKASSLKLKTYIRAYLSSGNIAYMSEDGVTQVRVNFPKRGVIQTTVICLLVAMFVLSTHLSISFELYARSIIYTYLLIDFWLLCRKTRMAQGKESDLSNYYTFGWLFRLRHAVIGSINIFALLLSFCK